MRLEELREELEEQQPKDKQTALSTWTGGADFHLVYGEEGRLQRRYRDGRIEEVWPYPNDPWFGMAGYD